MRKLPSHASAFLKYFLGSYNEAPRAASGLAWYCFVVEGSGIVPLWSRNDLECSRGVLGYSGMIPGCAGCELRCSGMIPEHPQNVPENARIVPDHAGSIPAGSRIVRYHARTVGYRSRIVRYHFRMVRDHLRTLRGDGISDPHGRNLRQR